MRLVSWRTVMKLGSWNETDTVDELPDDIHLD